MKNTNTKSTYSKRHFRPERNCESNSDSTSAPASATKQKFATESKLATETQSFASIELLSASYTLTVLIFVCLAKKGILSLSEGAHLLEGCNNVMADAPGETRDLLSKTVDTLRAIDGA